jgi:hypothetical protein
MRPLREQPFSLSLSKQKMNNTRHLGRKVDDSLPDFDTFVVKSILRKGCKEA